MGRFASFDPFRPNKANVPNPPPIKTPRIASLRVNDPPALSKNSFCNAGYLQTHSEFHRLYKPLPFVILLTVHVP